MSNFIKLISILLVSLSMILSNLTFSFNLNVQAKTKDNQSVTKKQIKKKLNLNYTDPRFETDLSGDQKNAILKSLKKWKGELPIDNLFTVTSIAKLKSDTDDENRQHKKKNKNIADALVIYMWSQTPNSDYEPNNPGDGEEGDPKFIRTQFNVLLKQNKNGGWKASLERDPETKTESADITETDEDKQIYNDLFAIDKADNGFTASEEVIIDDNAAENVQPPKKATVKSDSSEPVQITSTQKSSISSIAPVLVTPIDESSMKPEPIEKKTGWLKDILSFESIKVSAGVSEFSWPWTAGESWQVVGGWHECESYTSTSERPRNGVISGCALDISYLNIPGSTNVIKAPITSTITRFCQDPFQSVLNFGDKMSITHIKTSSLTTAGGAFVRKADTVGTVFDPGPLISTDPHWVFSGNPFTAKWQYVTDCGKISAPHIHVKFPSITDPLLISNPASTLSFNSRNLTGSVTVDGNTFYGAKDGTRGDGVAARTDGLQNYNPITAPVYLPLILPTYTTLVSQNTPNTNSYTGKIKALSNTNMVFDIKDYNGGNNAPVMLYANNAANTENQRWGYDNVNSQIKGMNGKCLDVGVTTNTPDRGLNMQDCTNSVNQKWGFNSSNQQIIWLGDSSKCIEALNGIVNYSVLVINTCNTTIDNQKWNVSDIVNLTNLTKVNVKVNLAGAWNNTAKLMNTDLNINNKIPLNQPYCTAPWNYCGNEFIPIRANMDQSAVDWVLIEIKDAAGITIQRKAALITATAALTNPLGVNSPGNYYPVTFDNITNLGTYKIIVRHRNHLAIATDGNVTLTPGVTTTVDLRQNVNVKSGNQSLIGTNSAGISVYGMRYGDVNSDGYIDSLDRTIERLEAETSSAYIKTDVNLDSSISATDRNMVRLASDAAEDL
jgi:Ricin-type beta-trefoil lectin domain/Dockerin type I domain